MNLPWDVMRYQVKDMTGRDPLEMQWAHVKSALRHYQIFVGQRNGSGLTQEQHKQLAIAEKLRIHG